MIGESGEPNRRIYDIAFPHALGVRPYSYGLQACNHTAGMVVSTWLHEAEEGEVDSADANTFAELQAVTD